MFTYTDKKKTCRVFFILPKSKVISNVEVCDEDHLFFVLNEFYILEQKSGTFDL